MKLSINGSIEYIKWTSGIKSADEQALDYMPVMSLFSSLAFVTLAACVAVASKLQAFFFVFLVVICARMRDPSLEVQR